MNLPATTKSSKTDPPIPVPEPHVLPSGRTLMVKADGGHEEIEIRSSTGDVEIRVKLTDTGPVLTLRGARLEIDSTDTVAVNCRQFELNTSQGVVMRSAGDIGLHSGAELRMKSAKQTFIDGDYVNLNCLERNGYHDHPDTHAPGRQKEDATLSLPTPAPGSAV